MKRDLNLIRSIILAVEDLETGTALTTVTIEGYTEEQIGYHSYLIIDSGLAEGFNAGTVTSTSPCWQIGNLTSAGHDFADLAHNEGNWKKTIGIVATKAGGASLDMVKDVLTGVVKSALGLT